MAVISNCPECNQVAFFVVQYPRMVECLCCGREWQLVRAPPEDLGGEDCESRLMLINKKIAAGRSRVDFVRNLAHSLTNPATAHAAEDLADLLVDSVRILESIERTTVWLQASKHAEVEPAH